jgi:UDP-4-amino-4,6-dideoxy-N-acetyl-beta-L-altrosamine transaminase
VFGARFVSGTGERFLPYGRHEIDEDDVAAVTKVLRGDWLTTGPAVEAFEAALAARTQATYATVCASATAGLHLAMMALRLGPDDRVIVPSITFLATANAARYVGAEVVFADVDADTALLTPATLEAALARAGGKARAVMPVHFGGRTVDLAGIAAVAERHGLAVVEDAAHAIGTAYGRGNAPRMPVGDCRYSRMVVFSFHAVKTIAMGEGGAVTTNDAALRESLARFRSHGMVRDAAAFQNRDLGFDTDGRPNPWYYEMSQPGYHYRATDIQCALGLSQLGKLTRFAERRRQLMDRYRQLLAPLSPIVRLADPPTDCEPAWHLCTALIDFAAAGVTRATVMEALRSRGIGTQVHYIPVHLQPYYRRRYGTVSLPGAAAYYARCLSLPLFPGMADGDVDRVVDGLAEIVRRH